MVLVPPAHMRVPRALPALAAAVAALAFVLVLAGGFVTASDSGLGCGSQWPVCRNALLPLGGDYHAWAEWAHRLLAGCLALGVAAVATLALRSRLRLLRTFALAAAALVAAEVVLGMATVLFALPAGVVAVHMLDAVAIVDVLIAVAYLAWREGRGGGTARPAPLPLAAAALAVLTAAAGSYVDHSGDGLACAAGPACALRLGHPGGAAVMVFGLHVLLGLVLVSAVVAAAPHLRRTPGLFALAVGCLGLQAGMGVALVAGRLAPGLLWVHEGLGVATAALVWLAAWAAGTGGDLHAGTQEPTRAVGAAS
ncbi:MAG: COX15/CtaA family protein [Firmicutes bacterium]|nr:COX15/CtaA family protein [Bacillota bacterium]